MTTESNEEHSSSKPHSSAGGISAIINEVLKESGLVRPSGLWLYENVNDARSLIRMAIRLAIEKSRTMHRDERDKEWQDAIKRCECEDFIFIDRAELLARMNSKELK